MIMEKNAELAQHLATSFSKHNFRRPFSRDLSKEYYKSSNNNFSVDIPSPIADNDVDHSYFDHSVMGLP